MFRILRNPIRVPRILKSPLKEKIFMKCPKCKTDNPDTLKFCGECGTQLGPSEGPKVSKTMTLETPAEGLSRGTLFAGRYEIIEELGTGGVGRVYRVEDTKLKQEIALKL